MLPPPPAKSAFSLVELSIVLVILGLLTGGILAGQSLIRAAELRSVSNDLQRYFTATQTFRDKYFALPGDMTNATAFWGKDNTNCTGNTGATATPGTCNGNGDGQVGLLNSDPNAINTEMFRFWQQLALSGLIEGTYSGISGAGSSREAIIGTNVPRSRVNNAGYTFGYISTGATWITRGDNYIYAGTAGAQVPTWNPFLKPEEIWNLDVKMDDGRPGTGAMLASETGCNTTLVASTSEYNLSNNSIACALLFSMRL